MCAPVVVLAAPTPALAILFPRPGDSQPPRTVRTCGEASSTFGRRRGCHGPVEGARAYISALTSLSRSRYSIPTPRHFVPPAHCQSVRRIFLYVWVLPQMPQARSIARVRFVALMHHSSAPARSPNVRGTFLDVFTAPRALAWERIFTLAPPLRIPAILQPHPGTTQSPHALNMCS